MLDRNSDPIKWGITHEFARWATHSALRNPGAPIKSRKDVYAALDVVDFDPLLDTRMGSIDSKEFVEWFTDALAKLMEWDGDARLNVGWAAKIISIYLKTTCYLAGFGREGLRDVIHPPIDNQLIKALKQKSWTDPNIPLGLSKLPNTGIIRNIDGEAYTFIMKIFVLIARERNCTLFEVEQFWGS